MSRENGNPSRLYPSLNDPLMDLLLPSSLHRRDFYQKLLFLLPCLLLAMVLFKKMYSWFYWRRKMARHGCKPMLMYPRRDPFLGTDLLFTTLRSIKNNNFLAMSHNRFKQVGNSFGFSYIGHRFFTTIDVENIRAVLATSSHHFELGSKRRDAMAPLLGRGIFGADGDQWRQSRAILRPNFAKHQLRGFDMPEDHFRHLLALIPTDEGAVVDLQDLFHKFTMDTATEFLFGRAVGALSMAKEEATDTFSHAFEVAMDALVTAVILGPVARLFTSRKVARARKEVHAFVQRFVDEALEYREKGVTAEDPDTGGGRYVFLHELAKLTTNRQVIQDEVLSALLGGRDTTASLLSNLFFCLARDSRVWAKLRREVGQLSVDFGQAELAGLEYVNMCINECKVFDAPAMIFGVEADEIQH